MTELQSHNNEFSNIDWLNRRNMNSSNTTATYSQQPPQPQQQQGSFNASSYAHQLPPIMSISSTGTSNAQLDHDHNHLNEDARKQQQQQLMSWDIPSATTTTDSTASGTSSYGHYQQNNSSPNMLANKSISISNSKKQRIPSTKDIHVEKNTDGKPPYSYATLIKYAIENSSNNKMTLSEIYQWVLDHYPYYGTAGSGWKNSIRHNLSLNKSFVRVPRPINEPGKGSYWVVDYRSAESEQRTRHLLPTSGRRNNRSGSDPSNNTPYRPEWSGSLSSSSSTSSFGRRDMRDVRSLSMDAAALSKSLNGVGLGGSYNNYKSVHGEDAGYYENAYAYGRQFATNQHQQRSLRHSTSYMPTSDYNVYLAADQAQYQQQLAGRNQPTNTVHPSSAVKQEQSNYVYDPSVTSTGTTNTGQQIYYSYGNGQPSPTPTSIIEKPNHPTKSDHAVYAALSPTPTPTALLPSPFAAPTSTHPQQQQPTYHNNQATSSCINHLPTSIKKEGEPTPTSTQDRRLSSTSSSASNSSCFYTSNQTPMALAPPPVKSIKQETTTAGGLDWDTML